MCGIAGLWDPSRRGGDLAQCIRAMTDVMVHRGPDSSGYWHDSDSGVALGHRRLSIVDLSDAGHQPMLSADGRWVLTYNGEIYNADVLRPELEALGVKFRGHSDTEVLIEACAHWGVEATLPRLIGMFAFGLWDTAERRLYLVRDRLGIKPLYWGWFDRFLLFGSEMKALRAHDGWTPEIDHNSVASYMRHNYVPGPWTIYRNVSKLPPGSFAVFRPGEAPEVKRYWSLEDVVRSGQAEPLTLSETEATDALEALLSDAVRRRMVADVPLGAFLSGGIDSSTVVALMQANASRPVRTFSIGFHEQGYNEAQHAKAVAGHLGTDHTELYVDPAHARDVIPRIPDMYDEPFADSSQIPTFLVSEMTRRQVTVALSGDGGDELFAGYVRYFQALKLFPILDRVPIGCRAAVAAMIRTLSPRAWSALFRLVPARWRVPQAGDKMHKLAGILREPLSEYYRYLISHAHEPDELVPGGREHHGLLWDSSVKDIVPSPIGRMQYLDTLTYLPDDILTKVDRASMAVSLEARVPLIDHRVVAFAWTLPPSLKLRDGTGKWLLRQVLARHVPEKLIDRPKMGFGVPIDEWLRGPLREWAEALLCERRLAAEGFLNPPMVREKWAQHLGGQVNNQYFLWNILTFQAWKDRWH
ncbi:MAG: asparagine synthase (glutamine-hydrolyzing) [Alphaproteobacteria bacterium]|nr:asparagine synthase (glutamine-hydrolyzing) [Alphaproteobacteria bacterium]